MSSGNCCLCMFIIAGEPLKKICVMAQPFLSAAWKLHASIYIIISKKLKKAQQKL